MSDPKARKTSSTLLEVEDEDARQLRIERLLQAQDSASTPSARKPLVPPGERSRPHHVPPPTELLARLEAFLPAMKKANEDLERKIASEGQASVDIENLGDEAESASGDDEREELGGDDEPQPKKPYIEMNLGLGVFEARPGESSSQTKQALAENDDDSSSLSTSSSSSDSESDGEDAAMKVTSKTDK
ncbi:hypothetical protein M407DRAFT_176721 [Tulasnella calospora MUT 4182]|uniref:Uncharacterized protein n=1 Tax=Tulasnella calospora MUT 4182 TaxID=1051891 RepID=A0A0C3M555_9AGAM|nr:hypothetical protein M407DRAFT_176721 [Tulasnella calospora MUT 4182]